MTENHPSRTDALLVELLKKVGSSQTGKVDALLRVLGTLESPNLNNVLNHFVETAKVLKVRQEFLGKPQLKAKEVRAALALIAFHYEKTREIDVRKNGLAIFIGKDLTEQQALDYYEKSMLGKVLDQGGREIIFDVEGMDYLYKDPEHGQHIIASANFQPIRAKRMPWIRWTIQNSTEVYRQEVERTRGDPPWHVFGYVYSFLVPFRDRESGKDSIERNYLFVVARRKKKDSLIEFVTAYHFDDHETLLKRVATFDPFHFTSKVS